MRTICPDCHRNVGVTSKLKVWPHKTAGDWCNGSNKNILKSRLITTGGIK